MGKNDKALRIDRRVEPNFADGDLPSATYVEDLAPPAPPSVPKPTNLQLVAYLTRSAQAGMAMIVASWDMMLNGAEADSFNIQVSTSATFDDGVTQTFVTMGETAALENLKTNTTYYVRVQAVYKAVVGDWSATVSILTPQDTTPPPAVTAVVWTWQGNGDLAISWTAPTAENYKDAEVRIYSNPTKTPHLQTMYGRNAVVWTAAMNRQATGNVPAAAVYIEVWSRSWNNVYSTTFAVPSSQPSKPVPAAPTGLTTSWAGDAGMASADCTVSWALQADANRYRLTIDGVQRDWYGASYTYTLATNRDDHATVPDPSLVVSLVAVDGLDQSSTAVQTVAVNVKPPGITSHTQQAVPRYD